MTMMTFEQFQATGKPCADIGAAISADFGTDDPVAGRLYLDILYIEEINLPTGRWSLQIGRNETVSDDLPVLERELYEFACDEGYVTE